MALSCYLSSFLLTNIFFGIANFLEFFVTFFRISGLHQYYYTFKDFCKGPDVDVMVL